MIPDSQRPQVLLITVAQSAIEQRIDNFLIRQLKGVPKTYLYRVLREGRVRVNGKRIKPGYRLQKGDQVRIPPIRTAVVQEKRQIKPIEQQALRERILYEDSELLILNKPAGMPVHGGSHQNIGLIDILRQDIERWPYLELVHRLDKETSGCLVLAKDRLVLQELHVLMRSGRFSKKYLALVQGCWTLGTQSCYASLRKNQLISGERIVRVDPMGKSACTHFKALRILNDTSLIEAQLETGRTHQIRVHLAYLGFPIVADEKYGNKILNKVMRKRGIKNLALHASVIDFQKPFASQHISIQAPFDLTQWGLHQRNP